MRTSDLLVQRFQALVQRYSKAQLLMGQVDFSPEHPVEEVCTSFLSFRSIRSFVFHYLVLVISYTLKRVISATGWCINKISSLSCDFVDLVIASSLATLALAPKT